MLFFAEIKYTCCTPQILTKRTFSLFRAAVLAAFLVEVLEDHKERWHEEKQCQCANDTTADDPRTETAVTIGADAHSRYHREHTEDKREDGHHNRSQTRAGSVDSGILQALARLAALGSVLGDKDSRFAQQTDQHDDTRLEVDIVLEAADLSQQERTHETYRHGDDDSQREAEGLVQCR